MISLLATAAARGDRLAAAQSANTSTAVGWRRMARADVRRDQVPAPATRSGAWRESIPAAHPHDGATDFARIPNSGVITTQQYLLRRYRGRLRAPPRTQLLELSPGPLFCIGVGDLAVDALLADVGQLPGQASRCATN